jgi:hypothetical protein
VTGMSAEWSPQISMLVVQVRAEVLVMREADPAVPSPSVRVDSRLRASVLLDRQDLRSPPEPSDPHGYDQAMDGTLIADTARDMTFYQRIHVGGRNCRELSPNTCSRPG